MLTSPLRDKPGAISHDIKRDFADTRNVLQVSFGEEVTIALGIGEGIESTLSLQRLPEWAGSPVWSLISEIGVRKFPLLSGIETLVIAADHDTAGERKISADNRLCL